MKAFVLAALLTASCIAAAQAYPSRPVTLVAPSTPGSAPENIGD
jgi:tripartite-type tricarboxylate transporter receptor subunit TctC